MLDHFFHPQGVAILGASDNPAKGGFHILRNALTGYKGAIFPVNPRLREIQGVPCYPDIKSIPGRFDLAIYFIPARFLLGAISDCADKGAKGIIIESAGFSEVGESGRRLQEDAVRLAHDRGVRLWGPNCMGLLDGHTRNVFSFMYTDRWTTLMKPGNVSLIVQSGMLSAGFLMTILERGGMGMAKVCSIGNKCDIDETDVLEYLANDPDTGVIGCYLESIMSGRKFLDIARSTAKPVVVLKSGRSDGGARAAMSHTASLSGSAAVYEGAFRQAGIVSVYDMHELMDFVRGFSKTPECTPRGGTAVVTFSGGAGIVSADLLADHGLALAELGAQTITAIAGVFPEWMRPSHPVDLWPAVELNGHENVYTVAVEAIMKDENVDSVIVETISWELTTTDYLLRIAEMKKRYGKPVALWLIGASGVQDAYRAAAEDAGVPVFTEITRCAAFLAGIREHFSKRGRMAPALN
jgi:acetate---CoA ligase (ADP-forming)